MILKKMVAPLALVLILSTVAFGNGLSAEEKSKVEARLAHLKSWGTAPEVVSAVKAYNTAPPAEYKGMTNEQWKGLTVLDPQVRVLSKNSVAEFLKSKKDEVVSEAFVSGANGGKVAFLAKTTYWNHTGKPKHDVPMSGKTWIGPVEVDESTGLQQVQVSVPVLDNGKPIGSIVVGLSMAKLK